MPMQCVYCHSETVVKNGTRRLRDSQVVQYYRCRGCHRNFNDPMARLRTPSILVEFALKNRSVGMRVRATRRIYRQVPCHNSAMGRAFGGCYRRLPPPAPQERDVTLEGDEVYTRLGENLSPPPLTAKVGR